MSALKVWLHFGKLGRNVRDDDFLHNLSVFKHFSMKFGGLQDMAII
jgi:hypothetical protein